MKSPICRKIGLSYWNYGMYKLHAKLVKFIRLPISGLSAKKHFQQLLCYSLRLKRLKLYVYV